MKAIVAAQSFVRGGIDADFTIIYGLSGPETFCALASLCFVLGVIAFTLPSKSDANAV